MADIVMTGCKCVCENVSTITKVTPKLQLNSVSSGLKFGLIVIIIILVVLFLIICFQKLREPPEEGEQSIYY
jgi:hypothetical protein